MSDRDVTVAAGRGVLFITGAKIWFILASYVVTFLLPRLLAGAAEFGVYSQVVTAVSIFNNVLITGTIQGVSRFSAQDDSRAPAVLRTALAVQLVVGLFVAGGYFGAAPWIAARFLHKPSLTPYLWLSAVVVFCYAIYAALVGSLNGRKLFHRQATLDVTYSTLRTGLTLGLAAAGFGVLGAVGGFATAAVVILGLALLWVGIGRGGPGLRARTYLSFVGPLYGYHLLLNCILLVDILLLSRAASITAEAAGLVGSAAEEVANAQAGHYKAAQAFAFIPYQLILSVAFVVFPLVSRATFEKDEAATQRYVRATLRFALVVVAGLAALFAARPAGIVHVVFPPDYVVCARALSVLAGGLVAFSLFVLCCTILNGAGRAGASVGLALVAVAGVVGLNLAFVPGREGAAALTATALCTSGGMLLGLLAAGTVLTKTLGAFMPAKAVVRVLVASTVVVAAGRTLPDTGKVATLGILVVLFVLYVVVLVVLRELGPDDLAKLRRIAKGR